jgi:DNA primase catalytic subunit
MIPTSQWYDLPEEHRTFVMDYKSKIKDKDSVKNMKTPDGFIYPTKARRMGTSFQTKAVTSEKKAETSKKKKIRFNLEQSQDPDDRIIEMNDW